MLFRGYLRFFSGRSMAQFPDVHGIRREGFEDFLVGQAERLPWQYWVVPPGPFVRDVVQLADLFGEPVVIRREFAVRPEPVPLDQLNWDLPAPWIPDPAGPITLRPGDQTDLDVPVGPQDGALVVRYTARTLDGGPQVRIINQAILGPGVVSGLRIKSDKQTITWNASPVSGTLSDLVVGRLSRLQVTGGIHDAACAPGGNDMPVPTYAATATPPAGDGDYYIVRSQNGAIRGTYDTTTDPLTREGRDLEIGPGDCP